MSNERTKSSSNSISIFPARCIFRSDFSLVAKVEPGVSRKANFGYGVFLPEMVLGFKPDIYSLRVLVSKLAYCFVLSVSDYGENKKKSVFWFQTQGIL